LTRFTAGTDRYSLTPTLTTRDEAEDDDNDDDDDDDDEDRA
jgi:hypothetical protein